MIEESLEWYTPEEKTPPVADFNDLETLEDRYLLFRVKGHRIAEKGYFLKGGAWFNLTHNLIPTKEVECWALMPKGIEP